MIVSIDALHRGWACVRIMTNGSSTLLCDIGLRSSFFSQGLNLKSSVQTDSGLGLLAVKLNIGMSLTVRLIYDRNNSKHREP